MLSTIAALLFALFDLVPFRGLAALPNSPIRIEVNIFVINIDRIDNSNDSYTVQFLLRFSCHQPCKNGHIDLPSFQFDVMNGEISNEVVLAETPTERILRVQATLNAGLYFRTYPFDSHKLPILIESRSLGENSVVLQEPSAKNNFSGIDGFAQLVGWAWLQPGWNAHHTYCDRRVDMTTDPAPQSQGDCYSVFRFDIGISRPIPDGLFRGILPALVLFIVGWLAFLVDPEKGTERIGVISSALVSSVLYHISFRSSIPSTGYLTYGDMFMIVNYLGLLLTLLSTVWLLRPEKESLKKEEKRRINKLACATTGILYAIAQIAVAINYLDLLK